MAPMELAPDQRPVNFCQACAVRNRAICADLDEGEIGLLNRIGRRRTLAAGEQLLWEGDEAILVANVIDGVLKLSSGTRDGREVVQVYTGLAGSSVQRAPRSLAGFASVELAAGESREVEVRVRRDDLAYWDVRVDRRVVEGGELSVEVGASSRDIRLTGTVAIDGDAVRLPLSMESSIADVMADPIAGPAAATSTMSRRGLRSRRKLTGTGLA